jgi:two-component system, cell cycle sensor histidine kinase and response regulator CckA
MGLEMAASKGGGRERRTVLVVEDHEDVRGLIQWALSDMGAHVLVAGSAADALAVAARTHIDLLVADVVLPDSNGLALASSLRSRHRGLPAIFVSGWFDHPMAPDLSGEVLLEKPFRLEELRSLVEDALWSGD